MIVFVMNPIFLAVTGIVVLYFCIFYLNYWLHHRHELEEEKAKIIRFESKGFSHASKYDGYFLDSSASDFHMLPSEKDAYQNIPYLVPSEDILDTALTYKTTFLIERTGEEKTFFVHENFYHEFLEGQVGNLKFKHKKFISFH